MRQTARMPRDDVLPRDLGTAVRIEYGLAFRAPYTTPIVVVMNAALMSAFWFLLPVGLEKVFFRYHSELLFPIILSAWMLADVPATNVLGPDAARSVEALDDAVMLRRLLYAKNVVLWSLVAPFCALVAIVIGIRTDRWSACLLAAAWILLVPAGTLGVANWLGILMPYHPRTLTWRWENRDRFRQVIFRWLSLAIAPYILVTWLAVLVMAPSFALWAAFTNRNPVEKIPVGEFVLIVVTAALVSAVMFFGGHRFGLRLALRRREALHAYLTDPELG